MVIIKKRNGLIEFDLHSASDTKSILIGIVKISRANRLPIKVSAIKTRWNPIPVKIFDFALLSSIGIVSMKKVLVKIYRFISKMRMFVYILCNFHFFYY